MKPTGYILIAILFLSCNANDKSVQSKPTVQTAKQTGSKFDHSGFTIVDVPNSDYQKAMRYDAEDKMLLEEGYLLDGKRQGAWIVYHQINPTQQRIQSITNYIDDKLNGIHIEVNQQNRIDVQRSYTQDQFDGKALTYKQGRLQEWSEYKAGQLHGDYRKYKDIEKLVISGKYKNGKLDGFYRTYDGGKITTEYEYKDGVKLSGGIKER